MRRSRAVRSGAPRPPLGPRLLRVAMSTLAAALPLLGLAWSAEPATASVAARVQPSPDGVRVVSDGTQGLTAGAAVPETGTGPDAAAETDRELARIRADGLNDVSLFVWWLAQSPTSDTLAPYAGTQSDASLTAEIRQARADGLSVTLTPVFYCTGCQGGWRGTMEPEDATLFFAAYESFVDHYAALAQADGVTTFFAGSEMSSLEADTSEWRSVISSVRRRFHGTVAYEENWDVLGQARFLDDVDLIGVSAYFPLDDQAEPDLTRLLSDWTSSQSSTDSGRDWVAELSGLAQRTGRPIVFGEAGYMSGDFAARQPFLDFQGQADWQLQSDLYQALLETFSGQSWWRGVDWWEWFPPVGGSTDDTRTPEAKTAETLLSDWYGRGWRPDSPDDALTLLASGQARPSGATAHSARIESVSSAVTIPGVVAPDRPLVVADGPAPAGTVAGLPGLSGGGGGLGRPAEVALIALLLISACVGAVAWLTLGRAVPLHAVPRRTRL